MPLPRVKSEKHPQPRPARPLLVEGVSAPRVPQLESLLSTDGVVAEEGIPALLDRLVGVLSARFAVLVRKDGGRRRTLDGRWSNGTAIGRPDKLLVPSHLMRVLRAEETSWQLSSVLEQGRRRHPQVGIRVRLASRTRAALLLGWRAVPDWLASSPCPLDPRAVARLVAAAVAVEDLRIENDNYRSAQPKGITIRTAAELLLDDPQHGDPQHGGDGNSDGYESELRSRFPGILGQSRGVLRLLQAIVRASRSDIPVLIEGESGTGKELVARAIHDASSRHNHQFVVENCGAVPESLVEAEFFGHEKGSFTGANDSRPGLFERAHGGTVFLDEVGELSPSTQKRLLRVLQEKQVRRVGGQQPIGVDFRVVSATNRVLENMLGSGAFREDLFYRLNVTSITAPPLRDRSGDVPLLIDHFNRSLSVDLDRPPLAFSAEAMRYLTSYTWPGNIRELRNEVWRLAALDVTRIGADILSQRILRNERAREFQHAGSTLRQIERRVLGPALLARIRQSGGNLSEAARGLGVSRSALYRRLQGYGLLAHLREAKRG